MQHYPNCGVGLKIIAAILDTAGIGRIFKRLGLPVRAPPHWREGTGRAVPRGGQMAFELISLAAMSGSAPGVRLIDQSGQS